MSACKNQNQTIWNSAQCLMGFADLCFTDLGHIQACLLV